MVALNEALFSKNRRANHDGLPSAIKYEAPSRRTDRRPWRCLL